MAFFISLCTLVCSQDIIYSTKLTGVSKEGQLYTYQLLQQATFTSFSTTLANNVTIKILGGLRMLCDVSADAGLYVVPKENTVREETTATSQQQLQETLHAY